MVENGGDLEKRRAVRPDGSRGTFSLAHDHSIPPSLFCSGELTPRDGRATLGADDVSSG